MNFYDRYVALCNRAGKSPSAIALEIGLSKPSVHRWKNGGGPTDATAAKIAEYFSVSVDYLLGKEDEKKPDGQKAIGLRETGYDELTDENKKVIDGLIATLLKSQSGG